MWVLFTPLSVIEKDLIYWTLLPHMYPVRNFLVLYCNWLLLLLTKSHLEKQYSLTETTYLESAHYKLYTPTHQLHHHQCTTHTHSWIWRGERGAESGRPCFHASTSLRRAEELKGSECLWGGKSQHAVLPSIQLLWRFQDEGVLGNARVHPTWWAVGANLKEGTSNRSCRTRRRRCTHRHNVEMEMENSLKTAQKYNQAHTNGPSDGLGGPNMADLLFHNGLDLITKESI